ncbi:MAG: DUF4375 domain-containing protein [Lachnospiraceae bacterium]|nr:DUF4375 domain-containing protein [Lachnospiraceae bacterium]
MKEEIMKEKEEAVNPETLPDAGGPTALPEALLGLFADNEDLLEKDTLSSEDEFRLDLLLKQAADEMSPFFDHAAPASLLFPLTLTDFADLSDEELFEALEERTVDLAAAGEPEELAGLPEAIQLFTRVNLFLTEFDDGGFAQYLCEPTVRAFFDRLPEDLREIGAEEHSRLLESFLAENHLEKSGIDALRPKDQPALRKKYNFDLFEEQFSELLPLWLLLTAHARGHQADWIGFPQEKE